MSFKNLEGQLARWLERIQQYTFEIVHRGGKSHGNADGLSRRHCAETNCNYCNKMDFKEQELLSRIMLEVDNLEDWKKDQLEDSTLMKIMHGKKENERPIWQKIMPEDSDTKVYWTHWDSLVLKNGILHRKWESPNLQTCIFQIVVLRKRIKQVLEEAHDSPSGGHFGVNNLEW